MRIMIVHSYYSPEIYGGAEYSVKKLAETLQSRGHTVRVLCSGGKDVIEHIDGVEVQRLRLNTLFRAKDVSTVPRWKRLLSHLISIWNYANAGMVDRAIKDFKPDVIHSNCLYGFSPIIWKVARKNFVRVVHTLRDYHLMCPLVAMSCKYTNGEKCISPKKSCRLHRVENRRHSCYVDCVTAPSRCTLDVLVQDDFFKESEKIVIPNAIDFNVDTAEKTLNFRMNELKIRKTTRFVYLGGLTEQKGIRWMVNAFRAIPQGKDVELAIAGKGLLKDYIEAEAAKDSRIRYVGFLDEKHVTELLHNSDVLLCPSLWDEPFGRVVLDAYKSGMPVISSNGGALPELVKDSKTGFVVDVGDAGALCSAMQRFVEDTSLITIYGRNAIEELNQYSLHSQAQAFEQVYSRKG